MKKSLNLQLLFLFCFGGSASADLVKLKTLTSFAEEWSYRDNSKSLSRDKIYSASKNCCSSQPAAVIEAYPEKASKDFKQIALWCDHCDMSMVSSDQIQLCKEEFTRLYKKVTKKDAPEKLKALVGSEVKTTQDLSSDYKIRFSLGSLKCDSKGGHRVRIDFFAY